MFYAALWYKRLKDNPELAKDRVRCQSSCLLFTAFCGSPSLYSLPWLAHGTCLSGDVNSGATKYGSCVSAVWAALARHAYAEARRGQHIAMATLSHQSAGCAAAFLQNSLSIPRRRLAGRAAQAARAGRGIAE